VVMKNLLGFRPAETLGCFLLHLIRSLVWCGVHSDFSKMDSSEMRHEKYHRSVRNTWYVWGPV
jgi:hypothetical protein